MPDLTRARPAGHSAALIVAGLVLMLAAACGEATGPTIDPRDTPGSPPVSVPTTPGATLSPAQSDYVSGSVPYRVVNLAAAPIDVYVRSQGLVSAWLVEAGLAAGEVLDYVSPPDPGSLVITTAGSDDPTCVGSCPHFLASIGNTSGSSSQSTVVIHPEGVTEYWEQPNPEDVGRFANALRPADPATALFFAIGQAVEGADFGLRLALADVDGCAVDVDQSNLLVGGTSVLVYAIDGEAELTVHDSSDRDCDQPPLGGPFTVAGEPGSRTLLLLYGSVDEMDALVLPIP